MKKAVLVIVAISFSVYCFSQVGINTTTPNAQLDIRSSNQASPNATDGILVPKVDVFPIGVNANQDAMLVYLTTTVGMNTPGFYYYNNASTSWLPMANGAKQIDDLLDGKSDSDGTNDGSSIFLGVGAGQNDDSSDNRNIGIGSQALTNSSVGYANVAIGVNTMQSNTIGNYNTALGYATLFNNIDGSDNLAIGSGSLYENLSGNSNIGLGINSLRSNTTGNQNTAIGSFALYDNTIGTHNLAIGENALANNIDGLVNTAVGRATLENNISGSYNVAVGWLALNDNLVDDNVGVGLFAMSQNTTGTNNTALGAYTMGLCTTGSNNTAVGKRALSGNGDDNTSIGYNTMYLNSTGSENVAIGSYAMFFNTTGNYNVGIGSFSMYDNTTGFYNVGIGRYALSNNTIGNSNTALGSDTLGSNTTGNLNSAFGIGALTANNGNQNVSGGAYSLRLNTSGSDNTALGYYTLNTNTDGINNTSLGSYSGNSSIGNNNVFIGYRSGYNETGNNKLYIESSSADANNALIYGEFDNNLLRVNGNLEISGETNLHRNVATGVALRVNGSEALWYNGTYFSWGFGGNTNYFADNVGISTTTPATRLHVGGNLDTSLINHGLFVLGDITGVNISMDANEILARNNGAVSDLNLQLDGGNVRVGGAIVHASDRRLKKDIEDLSYGLKELLLLQPKQYNWKNRKLAKYKSFGFIAQEVREIMPELVLESDNVNQTLSVNYTEIIPILLNAIQEQQQEIEKLKVELKTYKSMEARVLALEQNSSK